jgi:hypothetical protein
MTERQNTVVCTFDPSSPRINAYDIHEWIHAALKIPENKVRMIQIDGIKRQVFIKFVDSDSVQALISDTSGQAEYKYTNGELSIVNIDMAGMGTKHVRVASLPPETTNEALQAALANYRKLLNIQNETWSRVYRYPVPNWVRQITMQMRRHLPSHLTIAEQRVLITYEGQPTTSYGCGEVGHMYTVEPWIASNLVCECFKRRAKILKEF